MIKNYFTFDGVKSSDFNVFVSGSGTYEGAEHDVTEQTVPGRSGTILYDNNRFKQVTVKYPSFCMKDAKEKIDDFRDFLLTHTAKFYRLTDTYHPLEYRMAAFKGKFTVSMVKSLRAGSMTLQFNACPQRYLLSGENAVVFNQDGTIDNPTRHSAKPLIRVYGAGQVQIGAETFTIASNPFPYVDIDTESMMAYSGANNCNRLIALQSDTYPELLPGSTSVKGGSGVTKIEITPRWFNL